MEDQVVRALQIRDAHQDELMNKRNVVGTDVGIKYVGDKATEVVAIRIYVSEKTDDLLESKDVIPKELDGFLTDVIVQGVISYETDYGTDHNPLFGGLSIGGRDSIEGGTLGCFMEGVDSTVYGLTNYHVLMETEKYIRGERLKVGDSVLQPSMREQWAWRRIFGDFLTIGNVVKAVAGDKAWVGMDSQPPFRVDAAIFKIDGRGVENNIDGIGPLSGSSVPLPGMTLIKTGRTTGTTYGIIDGVGKKGETKTIADNRGGFIYDGIVTVLPDATRNDKNNHDGYFTVEGDSGSVYVDEKSRAAVGLHFAHLLDGRGRFSIGCSIRHIQVDFGASIMVTGGPKPPFGRLQFPFYQVMGTTFDTWAQRMFTVSESTRKTMKLTSGSMDGDGWLKSANERSPESPLESIVVRFSSSTERMYGSLYVCIEGPGAYSVDVELMGNLDGNKKYQGWKQGDTFSDGPANADQAGRYWYRVSLSGGRINTFWAKTYRAMNASKSFRLFAGRDTAFE